MKKIILLVTLILLCPRLFSDQNMNRRVDINPLVSGLVFLGGFGLGAGYEQMVNPMLSWRVTLAGGSVPIDEYGTDGGIGFFIPQGGIRFYPLGQRLVSWWMGANYGLLILHGDLDGNGVDSSSTYLLHELSVDTGINISFGRESHWYGTVSLFLSYVPGGEYWGSIDGDSSHLKMRGSEFLLLIPEIAAGFRF